MLAAHLLPRKKENIHASRKRDLKKSVPQRGGIENETRRSLLSKIQKFPKENVVERTFYASTAISKMLRAMVAYQEGKFNAIKFAIGYTTTGQHLTKSTKMLKNTYSCPPVHNLKIKKGEPFPDSAKRKSKEHLALLDSIEKSGTGI